MPNGQIRNGLDGSGIEGKLHDAPFTSVSLEGGRCIQPRGRNRAGGCAQALLAARCVSCPTVGWAKERSDVPIIWDVSPCQEKATFFLTKCGFGFIEKL